MKSLNIALAAGLLGASSIVTGCATLGQTSVSESRFDNAQVLRPFTVYFDYGDTQVTSAAVSLIEANHDRFDDDYTVGYIVVGHTDTSDEAGDNLVLSRERAEAVAQILMAEHNVSKRNILIRARGETDLAKETADGVREPLNRRVDVRIVNLGE